MVSSSLQLKHCRLGVDGDAESMQQRRRLIILKHKITSHGVLGLKVVLCSFPQLVVLVYWFCGLSSDH